MPNTQEYAAAVKQTFRSRALRTVLIIDDQFPTYADLFSGQEGRAKFEELDRALALYKLFKENHMPCDVENHVGNVAEDAERIRKSDLIVLDYHLAPNDSSKSIDLVQRLSATKHFNTVVLYTRETDLVSVWLNLACSLRGGWEPAGNLLAADEELLEQWDELAEEQKNLLTPTVDFMARHVLGGARTWPQREATNLRSELQTLGFKPADCGRVITALIHRAVTSGMRIPDAAREAPQNIVVGEFAATGPQWLQSRNCFVALLGKKDDDDDNGHPTDATRILDCLDAALTAWHPNMIQVLTSEIQNILELEALATDQEELRDPATHAGLSYYLLDALEDGTTADTPEKLVNPLEALIDKIVETLRHKLVTDEQLRELGKAILSEELRDVQWPAPKQESRAKMYDAAATMTRSRTGKAPAKEGALFALNSFLSTEQFRERHLTTGTIFRIGESAKAEHWVCASPSCDMVDRVPSHFQSWARALHPLRAMIAVRLHPATIAQALSEAPYGRHAFLYDDGPLAFSVVDRGSQQPVYEFFFAEAAGKCFENDRGGKGFRASRLKSRPDDAPGSHSLVSEEFVIVGQLRPSYASRILHSLGQHLSRIGLDFLAMPE